MITYILCHFILSPTDTLHTPRTEYVVLHVRMYAGICARVHVRMYIEVKAKRMLHVGLEIPKICLKLEKWENEDIRKLFSHSRCTQHHRLLIT